MKNKTKQEMTYWMNLIIGIFLAIFIWMSWKMLSNWIDNDLLVWGVTGIIILIAVVIGRYSIKGVLEKFKK